MEGTIKKYGANTEYRMLHYWVEKHLGKPRKCDKCGTTESKRFDWANISGKYLKDLADWKRLCRRCHISKDFCVRGHKLEGDNLLSYHLSKGWKRCRACAKLWNLKNPDRRR